MTVTVTVTKMADYGLYPGDRGHWGSQVLYKCSHSETGGAYYPNDLRTIYNDAGSEISYATWFSNLAAAGVNVIEVGFHGRNRDSGQVYSLEPPPYGTFNIWHSDLSDYAPGDLATFRSHQVTYPPAAGYWNASNLKAAIEAAVANGVQFYVALFEFNEFISDWAYHAWNSANKYADGTNCEAADQGFIANARDFFTNATAITAAKARIKFLIDCFDDYNVVAGWSLCEEIWWLMDNAFWGEASFNAQMITNIRTKIVPWVEEMAQYIRDNDIYNRPIGLSNARTPAVAWSADPDNVINVKNEPFLAYPLNIVEASLYNDGDQDEYIEDIVLLQEKHHPKVIWVTQYWPNDGFVADVEEVSPFLDSKAHQWIQVCGMQWAIGPLRWVGIKKVASAWQTGGNADGNYNAIGGISETFAGYVDWNSWADRGTNWDSNIGVGGAGLDRQISWGCTNAAMFYLDFSAGGNKTVTISGIDNGGYHVYLFDWEDGTLDETKTPVAAGNSLSFTKDVTGFDRYVLVGYAVKD